MNIRRPYFLAGGLSPDNVGKAVTTLHPFAVDVSSGIETGGTKDKIKMAAFLLPLSERKKNYDGIQTDASGIHGGQYIPETLMNAVIELEEAYNHYKNDPEFNRELAELFNEYAGRPSRLYYAEK